MFSGEAYQASDLMQEMKTMVNNSENRGPSHLGHHNTDGMSEDEISSMIDKTNVDETSYDDGDHYPERCEAGKILIPEFGGECDCCPSNLEECEWCDDPKGEILPRRSCDSQDVYFICDHCHYTKNYIEDDWYYDYRNDYNDEYAEVERQLHDPNCVGCAERREYFETSNFIGYSCVNPECELYGY